MDSNILSERKEWFRYFPEGSIEFVLITRVLGLIFLVALAFVRETQRPAVLIGLVFVLWADYVLMLWWVVQMAMDLDHLFEDPPLAAEVSRRQRFLVGMVGLLPSIVALVILAPWAEYLIRPESARTALMRIMEPALMLLFLVLVCFGYGALRRLRLGPAKWTLLLLIPIFHWFAVHRMVTNLHSKLQHRMQERGHVVKDEPGFKALILVSDITWILSMLPWGLILFLSLLHNHWPVGLAYSAIRICGIAFAVVFAVGNLASMEYLQRQFVNEIHKL